MVTTLFFDILDAQGQLTPMSVMESCPNSNLSKLLFLSLLPARMKKIHPKMKALEWSQHFFHSKSMGIFPDAQGNLTSQALVRSCPFKNPRRSNGCSRYLQELRSSPMGNDRLPGSQHNVWKDHNLWCSMAGYSDLKQWSGINSEETIFFRCSEAANLVASDGI